MDKMVSRMPTRDLRDLQQEEFAMTEHKDWCVYDAAEPRNVMHNLTRAETEAFERAKLAQKWIASTEENYKLVIAMDFP